LVWRHNGPHFVYVGRILHRFRNGWNWYRDQIMFVIYRIWHFEIILLNRMFSSNFSNQIAVARTITNFVKIFFQTDSPVLRSCHWSILASWWYCFIWNGCCVYNNTNNKNNKKTITALTTTIIIMNLISTYWSDTWRHLWDFGWIK